MSKERLEEIKMLWEQNNDVCFPDDYEWLIEQAEQVQELEEIKDAKIVLVNKGDEEKRYVEQEKMIELEKAFDKLDSSYIDEVKKNKRYRELLEKIKEMTRYDDCREAEIYELVSDELEGEE